MLDVGVNFDLYGKNVAYRLPIASNHRVQCAALTLNLYDSPPAPVWQLKAATGRRASLIALLLKI